MRHSRSILTAVASCAILAGLPASSSAQGWMNRIKSKAKEAIQQKTDNAADSVANAAVNTAGSVVKCAVSDKACIKNAEDSGKSVSVVNGKGQPVSSADSASAMNAAQGGGAAAGAGTPAASAPPGAGVWLNYDFVPGDKVLYYEDFSDAQVGDLPKHLDITDGNVAVVDIKGTKYLRSVTGGTAYINLPTALPQRFTIEVVFHRSGGNGMGMHFRLGKDKDDLNFDFRCDQGSAAISGDGANGRKESGQGDDDVGPNDFQTCRLMVDSGYAKVYINNKRLGQLSGLDIGHGKLIEVELANGDDNGSLITGIRIAEGGRPLYDALTSSGRVSTHGILFATGSAAIQGESTPTLKEIGDMLQQHPDLKLEIDGHTDNVGNAAANQALSEKRAAAVREYLVSTYKIDPARLTSKGLGDTKPVSPNTTPQGRQMNRRVELVKM
jgi:outer membrane protein OmpA-like peptidoglycan-associated protein